MRWSSFLAGIAALTMLDAALSSGAAAGRAGGALSLVGSGIQHLLSPASPLIPDLRKTAAAIGSSSSTGPVSTLPTIQPLAPTSAAPPAATIKSA